MATARVKQGKVEKLEAQRRRLNDRVVKAGAAVTEARAEEARLKAELERLDAKIAWQKAEPVDEETGQEDAGE